MINNDSPYSNSSQSINVLSVAALNLDHRDLNMLMSDHWKKMMTMAA